MTQKKTAKRRVAAAKKKPARQAGARRRRKSTVTKRRALVEAPPDKCFWLNHGPVLKNLRELRDALVHVSDGQFAHHVGPERNDFASWVEGVLRDAACAKALRRAKTPRAAVRAVEATLASYA